MLDPKLAVRFAAIVDHGSITAAARAMGVAQPWMSEQLRKLEDQVGAPLLVRTPRRLELTEAGERFLPYAQKIATAAAAAERFFAEERAKAVLRIGAIVYTVGAPERAYLTDTFLARHPGASLEIDPGRTADLLSALIDQRLDLVMVCSKGIEDRRDLEMVTIVQKYGHLYVPADDPLAGRPSVPLSEIAGRELVIAPGRDDPQSMHRSLAPLVAAGARLLSAPDMDRLSVQAFALHRSAACLWWGDRAPRTDCGPQTIVPFEGYPVESPIALVRRRGDSRRHVRWMWSVAREIEDQITAGSITPVPQVPSFAA